MCCLNTALNGRAVFINGSGEGIPRLLWLVREVCGSQVIDGTTPAHAERGAASKSRSRSGAEAVAIGTYSTLS